MVEYITTLKTLYENARSNIPLKNGNDEIPPRLLRDALHYNHEHLKELPERRRVKISTEHDPSQNPVCFLGHIVFTGFCDSDPELLPAWMYKV